MVVCGGRGGTGVVCGGRGSRVGEAVCGGNGGGVVVCNGITGHCGGQAPGVTQGHDGGGGVVVT